MELRRVARSTRTEAGSLVALANEHPRDEALSRTCETPTIARVQREPDFKEGTIIMRRPASLALLLLIGVGAAWALPANALDYPPHWSAWLGGRPVDIYVPNPNSTQLLSTGLTMDHESEAAYKESAERTTLSTQAHYTVRRFVSKATNTQVLFAEDNRALVVAVRGSQEAADWVVDIAQVAVMQLPVRVHPGFWAAADSIYPQVQEEALAAAGRGKQVWITGHSLGGSIAQILAFRLKTWVTVAGVHTFGSPAVGDQYWAQAYDVDLRNKTHRWVNLDDPIPCYPANPQQWQQAGRQHVLSGTNVSFDSVMTSCRDAFPSVTRVCEPTSWWGRTLYWVTGVAGICHVTDFSLAVVNLVNTLSRSDTSMHRNANYEARIGSQLPPAIRAGLIRP